MSDLKDLKRAFDTVVNKYGTLDIMVCFRECFVDADHMLINNHQTITLLPSLPASAQINNAGLGTGDLAFDASLTGTESDPAPWSLMHSVNTTAVFYGTQLAITEFSSANGGKGKKGVIVCTASMAAFNTDDGNLAIYGSGKAAIVYFVRKVQSLLKSRNSQIRINAVCPAGAATAMLKQGAEIPEWKEMFGKIMKRFQVPVDSVADAMMLCVEQEELKGEALRVVPQGIETWDFAGNKRKALLAKI